jgi:MoaA/NifB/PqqE/SkfB family radical SAM enzyme
MCNVWKIYREQPELAKSEMTLEHFTKLFSELGPSLLWLHITGGEPFLRTDLLDIIKVAIAKCKNLFIIDMSTNGLEPRLIIEYVSHIAELLERQRIIFSIGVSLDGPQDVHDHVRGVKGAWRNAIETLKNLKLYEKSYGNLYVHVNYTITRFNAGSLATLYNELQKIIDIDPCDISISLEHAGISFNNIASRIDYEIFKDNIMKDLLWFIENCRVNNKVLLYKPQIYARTKLKKMFVKLAVKYIENPLRMVLPCEALRSSIFIDPYGNVYPCTIWGVKLGNIKNQSLREIIRLRGRGVRALISSSQCPNCWSGCEAMTTLLVRCWRAF